MYSPATASPFGRSQGYAQAYKQVGVATGVNGATPHQLVQMLFDGYIDAIAEARGAMRAGHVELKCKALARAARIVDEGLKASLNLNEGGALAEDLRALYEYIALRLTQANLRNDEALLDECSQLIEPLRQAWMSIGPQVETR